MKIKKLSLIQIIVYCLFVNLWSGAIYGMEGFKGTIMEGDFDGGPIICINSLNYRYKECEKDDIHQDMIKKLCDNVTQLSDDKKKNYYKGLSFSQCSFNKELLESVTSSLYDILTNNDKYDMDKFKVHFYKCCFKGEDFKETEVKGLVYSELCVKYKSITLQEETFED